jgi:PPOX class probable FMN-dependent enzyme
MMYQPTNIIEAEKEIRDLLGETSEVSAKKVIDHIDDHCRAWIERSPFVVVCTADRNGRMDVAPKGDPPGFVKVLDAKTLAIPDRPGNRRADSFLNILENPKIGLMFVVPKRGEVVRVSGSAKIVRDSQLLESMAINGRVPALAILVRVEEAFYHCGKAMIRSRMWQPDQWPDIEGLPSYAQALLDHGHLSRSLTDLEELVTRNERERLY